MSNNRSDGSCARFNNASQRVFHGVVFPHVYAWQTNDPQHPWYAEARLLDQNGVVVAKFAQSSARWKQKAKDLAANTGYQHLRAQYPTIDLDNI